MINKIKKMEKMMYKTAEKMDNVNKELESVWINQMDILELKNTIFNIKNFGCLEPLGKHIRAQGQ